MTKHCEIFIGSQSLVVIGLALFHGVLAVTLKPTFSSSRGGGHRFEPCFAHTPLLRKAGTNLPSAALNQKEPFTCLYRTKKMISYL